MINVKKTIIASVAGLSLIAGFEGYREYAYVPVKNDILTIGFGHTGNVKEGDKVDLTKALIYLEQDVAVAERAVRRHVKVDLTQNQIDALVSFIYNVGEANFAGSTLLKCINSGNEPCVDAQWMRWKYFKKKVLPGLEKRRAIELAVYRGKSVWWLNSEAICVTNAGCVSANHLAVERPSGAVTAGDLTESGS